MSFRPALFCVVQTLEELQRSVAAAAALKLRHARRDTEVILIAHCGGSAWSGCAIVCATCGIIILCAAL